VRDDRSGWGRPERRRDTRLAGRTTDRVEDLAAWLTVAFALLVVVAAVVIGRVGHDLARAAATAEAADHIAVDAVLLEATDRWPSTARSPRSNDGVPARWTAPAGAQAGAAVVGTVPVTGRHAAGDTVPVWLDGTGRVVAAPPTPATLVAVGWIWGVLAALAGWAVLLLAWLGVQRATAVRNQAAWARDWARVEPGWSGRVR
jgi:hypothetical protein